MSDSDTDSTDDEPAVVDVASPRVALGRAVYGGEPLEVFRAILEANEIDREALYVIIQDALDLAAPKPEIIRLLVMHDTSVAMHKTDCGYLLHIACWEGDPFEIIQLLLELNPNAVREKDHYGNLPLHGACNRWFLKSNDRPIDTIKLLLDLNLDAARQVDRNGCLPLHHVTRNRYPEEIVLTLLEAFPGAARIKDDGGKLPLHYASYSSNIVTELTQLYPEGATVLDNSGNLPLHAACFINNASIGVVKCLVEAHPPSVYVTGKHERYPLHCAAGNNPSGKREIIEYLIEQYPGAVSAVDSSGKLPVHIACEYGASREVVELLLDQHEGNHNGLDVIDNTGRTPLHYPSLRTDAQELMLERYPAATSVADNDGMLPVHRMVHRGMDTNLVRIFSGLDSALVPILLEANLFSVLQTTRRGLTPLQIASCRADNPIATRNLLMQKQDEAVRLIRDAIVAESEEIGLPDSVVLTICSFMLPKILNPIEEELKW